MHMQPDNYNGQQLHGWSAVYVVFVLTTLLMLYALSIGPVMMVYEMLQPGTQEKVLPVLVIVYYPLQYLILHVPWIYSAYEWYFQYLGLRT